MSAGSSGLQLTGGVGPRIVFIEDECTALDPSRRHNLRFEEPNLANEGPLTFCLSVPARVAGRRHGGTE